VQAVTEQIALGPLAENVQIVDIVDNGDPCVVVRKVLELEVGVCAVAAWIILVASPACKCACFFTSGGYLL